MSARGATLGSGVDSSCDGRSHSSSCLATLCTQLSQLVINYSYAYITFGDEFTNRRGERRRLQKQAASATQGNEGELR